VVKFIRERRKKIWESWLEKNIHRTKTKVLDRNKIFIFPSGQGFFFCATIICLFIAGINYANSLVLVTCFMLASLFLVTILHTFRNLSGLEVSIGRIENTFVGENALFTVRLKPLFDRPYEAVNLVWHGVVQQADILDQTQADIEIFLPCDKRGVFKPARLKLESKFPLGIVTTWAYVDFDCSCLVYPKPINNDSKLGEVNSSEQEGKKTLPRGVEDFDMLRHYQAGDSLRHIDWKSYAKTDELYTKSFVDYADEHVWLDWDTIGDVDVELKLSYLCYWVLKLSEKNVMFGLRLPGRTIAPALGDGHKTDCLETLALAKL